MTVCAMPSVNTMFTASTTTGTPALSAPAAETALQLLPVFQFPVTTLFFQYLVAWAGELPTAEHCQHGDTQRDQSGASHGDLLKTVQFICPGAPSHSLKANKKADVAEHPEAFHHVGLLVNGSSAAAGLPFI